MKKFIFGFIVGVFALNLWEKYIYKKANTRKYSTILDSTIDSIVKNVKKQMSNKDETCTDED